LAFFSALVLPVKWEGIVATDGKCIRVILKCRGNSPDD
jgi:hypothetical protein